MSYGISLFAPLLGVSLTISCIKDKERKYAFVSSYYWQCSLFLILSLYATVIILITGYILQIFRHVKLLISRAELENVPDGPKVGIPVYLEKVLILFNSFKLKLTINLI